MGFGQSEDLKLYDTKDKGRKIMGFTRSKDLNCYEERRKKLGFYQSKDLKKERKNNNNNFRPLSESLTRFTTIFT